MPSVRANRGRRRTLGAAAALALAACLLSSCGTDSKAELSQQRASELRSSLSSVEDRVAGSDCTGATQQAGAFREKVSSLPSRVDRDLRNALEESAARLEQLVADQCKPETPAPVEEAPPETTVPDENAGDQNGNGKKDKKPKKQKDEQPPPDTGATGQEGSTGVTGPNGGAGVPQGGE